MVAHQSGGSAQFPSVKVKRPVQMEVLHRAVNVLFQLQLLAQLQLLGQFQQMKAAKMRVSP